MDQLKTPPLQFVHGPRKNGGFAVNQRNSKLASPSPRVVNCIQAHLIPPFSPIHHENNRIQFHDHKYPCFRHGMIPLAPVATQRCKMPPLIFPPPILPHLLLPPVILIFWVVLLELSARIAHHLLSHVAKSASARAPRSPAAPSLPTNLVTHLLIDQTCPVSTHTPSEVPHNGNSKTVLPPAVLSPCRVCDQGIAMGMVIRRLPCGHCFHARCIDRVSVLGRTIRCVVCGFVVVATPHLIRDEEK